MNETVDKLLLARDKFLQKCIYDSQDLHTALVDP